MGLGLAGSWRNWLLPREEMTAGENPPDRRHIEDPSIVFCVGRAIDPTPLLLGLSFYHGGLARDRLRVAATSLCLRTSASQTMRPNPDDAP